MTWSKKIKQQEYHQKYLQVILSEYSARKKRVKLETVVVNVQLTGIQDLSSKSWNMGEFVRSRPAFPKVRTKNITDKS